MAIEIPKYTYSSTDERRYKKLCRAVTKINSAAGLYLKNAAQYQPAFVYDGDLLAVFKWTHTASGYDFWAGIYFSLNMAGYDPKK